MSAPVLALTYVEIDVPSWVPTDPPTVETLRYAIDTDYLPPEIEAIPSLKSVVFTPATVSLGEDLGQRATVRAIFRDHRHVFAGEAFDSGTYWGKFRGNYGQRLGGLPFRLIHGELGQTLAEMTTRHFFIETTQGPDPKIGEFVIDAEDVFSLTRGARAMAPLLSNGFLKDPITSGAASAELSPVGIGDEEYPESGLGNFGGRELCTYTRSAGSDVLNLTRAQKNTEAQAHSAGDRVQICIDEASQDPGDIIERLLLNYTTILSSNIPIPTWNTETAAFLGVLYSRVIAEPTPVDQLVASLIQQAGLTMWWDEITRLIGLKVLTSIPSTAQIIGEDMMLEDTGLVLEEQPDKRLSQVWVYFGLINPLKSAEDTDNYRSQARAPDEPAEAGFGGPAIGIIKGSWIPEGGRAVADQLAAIRLSRFVVPPRRIAFDLFRDAPVSLDKARGARLSHRMLQDKTGAGVLAPIQVTRVRPEADRRAIEAEEMLFDEPPNFNTRIVILDSGDKNINLRAAHDLIYTPPTSGKTIVFIVPAGFAVGSASTSLRAIDAGSWPAGVTVILAIRGRGQGAGGKGGRGGRRGHLDGDAGVKGGVALYTRTAIKLDLSAGGLWGGGGGGGGGGGLFINSNSLAFGGGGGGGGAGADIGPGGQPGPTEGSGFATAGADGDDEFGGVHGDGLENGLTGDGGDGADAGQAGTAGQDVPEAGGGSSGNGGAAGAAGAAIDGVSFVTLGVWDGTDFTDGATMTEDIRGPEIN